MYAVKTASNPAHQPRERIRSRVSGGDEDQRIGDAVGQVVVDLARFRAELPFDRDHAVEQIADQPQLDRDRGDEQDNTKLWPSKSAAPAIAAKTTLPIEIAFGGHATRRRNDAVAFAHRASRD